MVSKYGGPKMDKNGKKWPAKMRNQDFSLLHHRIEMTFTMCLVIIEPINEKISAGQ
jgi:hypothetical protein